MSTRVAHLRVALDRVMQRNAALEQNSERLAASDIVVDDTRMAQLRQDGVERAKRLRRTLAHGVAVRWSAIPTVVRPRHWFSGTRQSRALMRMRYCRSQRRCCRNLVKHSCVVQEATARVQKVRRATYGAMLAQEQVITPMPAYEPVSGFDANDRKRLAAGAMTTRVTNNATLRADAHQERRLAQLEFLRRVEQVCHRQCAGCIQHVT